MPPIWSNSRRRRIQATARGLRLVAFDVDGVMTDGGIYFVGAGEEARRFDVRDGMGVVLARNAGLRTAIISSRSSVTVRRRAEELGIDALYEGHERKGEALDLLLEEQALRPEEVAYLGDDLQDLPVMNRVGLPIAVADARPEVIRRALHVTRAFGGHGAVREAIEWILEARGEMRSVLKQFTEGD